MALPHESFGDVYRGWSELGQLCGWSIGWSVSPFALRTELLVIESKKTQPTFRSYIFFQLIWLDMPMISTHGRRGRSSVPWRPLSLGFDFCLIGILTPIKWCHMPMKEGFPFWHGWAYPVQHIWPGRTAHVLTVFSFIVESTCHTHMSVICSNMLTDRIHVKCVHISVYVCI